MKRFIVSVTVVLFMFTVEAVWAEQAKDPMRAARNAQYNNQHEAAIKQFEQAFSQGVYEAFLPLAQYYYSSEYKNDMRLNALIKQLEQASEQGNADASEMARQLYFSKEFANATKAFHHAQLSAANSKKNTEQWVNAHMLLAEFYFAGVGIAQNVETGLNIMKRVAYSNDNPNRQVHVQLGMLYGKLGNIDESAKWFNSGIKSNAGYKRTAKSLISDIYYQLGLKDHSVQAAFEFFERKPLTTEQLDDLKTFAEDGDQDVQLALAIAFAYGEGTNKNQQLAELYFQKAISNDDLASLKTYISWLDNYVDTTYAKAFPYVIRAAKQNDPKSMGRVSDHYLKGIGTAINYSAARDWAVRAIGARFYDAENTLALALLKLTPPSSSNWNSYVENTRGGKLYTANSAKYGPLNYHGRGVQYVLDLTKYSSIQTAHYDAVMFEHEYTNFVTAYRIDCQQRELQEIGYMLLHGDKLVYDALDRGRGGWGKPSSTSTTSRLLQRICN